MSLESLMNIEVTSVSRKEQRTSQIAAAVFVINQDDIRRSGANNIPDLLRMVPGVQVGQINANTWAISIRGFDQQFSNKLLVLLDGRSVYLPTFSGVFWDVLDVPLEDIERIEVIRGPGATSWGANAVNGVINIITKKASATRGTMLVSGGGNVEPGFATLQHGGSLGRNSDYRVFTKYLNQHDMVSTNAPSAGDGWHIMRGGFRLDTSISSKDELFVLGDIYGGRVGGIQRSYPLFSSGQQYKQTRVGGGYVQSEWSHRYSERTSTALRLSLDHYGRADALNEDRDTFNLDFENRLVRARHDVVWGIGYRYSDSDSSGSFTLSLIPPTLSTSLFSWFAEDEIALVSDRLWLTLGTKLEHNYYTGFGWMPSVRLAWKESTHHMFWAAVSRALRTPSSVDTGMLLNSPASVLPNALPLLVRTSGNPNFQDETLLAYEGGYRAEITKGLSLDIGGYFNTYDQLKTAEPGTMYLEANPSPTHAVLPLRFANLMEGHTYGLELSTNWKATERWTLQPRYALEQVHLKLDHGSRDLLSLNIAEGGSPHQWAQLESHLDLPRHLGWDVGASFTDRLSGLAVPSYVRVDSQLSWDLAENISISMVGQNLLKARHLEFSDPRGAVMPSLLKRSAYAKLVWSF